MANLSMLLNVVRYKLVFISGEHRKPHLIIIVGSERGPHVHTLCPQQGHCE
jgi:hypothetical protein